MTLDLKLLCVLCNLLLPPLSQVSTGATTFPESAQRRQGLFRGSGADQNCAEVLHRNLSGIVCELTSKLTVNGRGRCWELHPAWR